MITGEEYKLAPAVAVINKYKKLRYCHKCGKPLVKKPFSIGQFDSETGEEIYQIELRCLGADFGDRIKWVAFGNGFHTYYISPPAPLRILE